MAFEPIPGDVPVLETGSKLVALHPFKTQKGEARFGISEVIPAKMNGREVSAWSQPYGGIRMTFETPVECEAFLKRALVALESLKVKPRPEAPLA